MWNNVKLLNMASSALFALALLITALFSVRALMESSAFPLRTIRVEGQLAHVGRAEVVTALQGRLSGTFFNVDLVAVREMFETIPWVRRAEVRRMWPGRLEIQLEEHVALARWGQAEDGRLVNTHGEVFNGRTDASLPLFAGPTGTEAEVTQRYGVFRQAFAPLSLEPRAVVLSPRFSWQVRLSNGLSVQLGRDLDKDRIADRLSRFVGIYPRALVTLSRRLDYVDLRYPNGFALRVPGMSDTDKAAARPVSAPATKSAGAKATQDKKGAAKNGKKADKAAKKTQPGDGQTAGSKT